MEKKKYIYRYKKKYMDNVERYGFTKYDDENGELETMWGIPFLLEPDYPGVKAFVATCNDKEWQRLAKIDEEESRENFAKEGMEFKQDEEENWKLVETEEVLNEFRSAFLGVSFLEFPHNCLFILASDGVMHYAADFLEKHASGLISELVSKGVIYKCQAIKPKKEKGETE